LENQHAAAREGYQNSKSPVILLVFIWHWFRALAAFVFVGEWPKKEERAKVMRVGRKSHHINNWPGDFIFLL
jgi:hypothetical protein